MHGIRSAILSGDAPQANGPVAVKRKKAEPVGGSLTAIAVKRTESRLGNQRREERHRDLFEEATLYFRRRKYHISVVNVSASGAMLDTDLDARIGEKLQIQFSDCNKTECVVRWRRGNRLGIEFNQDTTIIASASVQDYIIRKLRGDAPDDQAGEGAQASRAPRQVLIWFGTIHYNHDTIPVRLRNISTDGAMLESEHPFAAGAEILLDLEDAGTAFGKVRWAKGGQIGVKFDQKFDLKQLGRSTVSSGMSSDGKKAYMMKPRYLETDGAADSPWAAMWDKFTPEELERQREIERHRARR
jgi:hypothetical protein